MKIGELFIALGFKVNGSRELDEVEQGVERTAVKAVKLTVAVNAVNAALLAMLDASARVGRELVNFDRSTGLSQQNLQFWQHAAVTAGVGADALTAKVKHLQDVRASFALGEPQDVGAWSLLGVDPRQDPFAVIAQLRQRVAGVKDVGVARSLLGRVGLAELLPLLRSTNQEFEKWQASFLLTERQTARLARLNGAWESLKRSVASVRDQTSAGLAPVMERLARLLEWVASKLAVFTQWLGSSSTAARVLRTALGLLAVALLGVGAGLAGVTVALGALLTLLIALSPAILGLAVAFTPLAIVLGVLAGALLGLVLLLDDFWTAADGGKSFFQWNKGLVLTIDNVNRLARGLENLLRAKNAILSLGSDSSNAFFRNNLERMASASARAEAQAVQITNNVDTKVQVDGSGSPEATGNAVGRSIKGIFRAAQNQAPVPNR